MKNFKQFLREANEELASQLKDDMDFIETQLKKKLKVFSKNHLLGFDQSTLGGETRRALMISYFSDTKDTAISGIIQNSKVIINFRIDSIPSSTPEKMLYDVEAFRQSFFKLDTPPKKFRKKSKVSKEKIVDVIVKWFNANKKVITIKTEKK